MISTSLSLSEKTKDKLFSEWLGIINRRDSGSILHLAKRDQLYRVNAFLQSQNILKKYLKKPHEFQFILLDLTAQPIEDKNELAKFMEKETKPGSKRQVLLVLDADKLLDEKMSLLASIDSLYHARQNLSILYFFRRNITHTSLTKLISPFTSLYQNVLIFPFLAEADSLHFLNYLEKKFEFKLSQQLIKQIIKECGGIPMLIKQAYRYYLKTRDIKNIFTHDEIQLKLQILWEEFDPWEKKILEKIVKHKGKTS